MASANDGTNWERVARRQLERRAEGRARDLKLATNQLASAFSDGDATPDDFSRFRSEVNGLLDVVENDMAALTDGVEPFGDAAPYFRDTQMAADYLDVELDAINEAENGATVEIGETAIRELVEGHSVRVETPAGIEVELQPTTTGETNTGP
ncbi:MULTISPECIES: hypothetical protein [Halobacterium]|uniref:hypothetical protein n=1 Tax=Halobacterium TaxID=2239 RepID=UPI00073E2EA4|nr:MULTISPECIES: hypothetical protein [Halobacterium]MCG1004884.1 hypothetical protein [Halobacterium noricense]